MTTKPSKLGFEISGNVGRMQASTTLAADALRATGVSVFDFGAGEPDFDTPENIKRAAAEAMRAGKTKYTPTGVDPDVTGLRAAFVGGRANRRDGRRGLRSGGVS
jgi:aspartate/methionine/tyrosine aminotransferase